TPARSPPPLSRPCASDPAQGPVRGKFHHRGGSTMSVASLRRTPRFPTPTALGLPGRRAKRRHFAMQPHLRDLLLEDRTLLAFTPISQPTAAYVANTTLIPITGADRSTTTFVTDGTESVFFATTMTRATVPAGGWNNWGSPPDTESNSP